MKRTVFAVGMVGLALGLIVGISVTRGGEKFYKWLPEKYSETSPILYGDWQGLRMVAYENSEAYLTEKLIQTRFGCYVFPESLVIGVGTRCQPAWNHYTGSGRFDVADRELRAACMDAVNSVLITVGHYFPEAKQSDIHIKFFIQGQGVGAWHDGQLKLAGE